MVIRGSFSGVKRTGREADHSPPFSAEVKECVELYLQSPNTPSWLGVQLNTGTTLSLPLLDGKRSKQVRIYIYVYIQFKSMYSLRFIRFRHAVVCFKIVKV
jgi:hypothetical protein